MKGPPKRLWRGSDPRRRAAGLALSLLLFAGALAACSGFSTGTSPGEVVDVAAEADPDGPIHMPDAIALRGLPDEPGTALARQRLRDSADDLEGLGGFSTTAPIRIALSAEIDLATVGEDSLFLFELTDPSRLQRADEAESAEALVEAGEALGVERDEVALALWFPTLPIEDDLVAVQQLLRERIDAEAVTFEDPDRSDDLTVGFFPRGEATFAEYLDENPDVSAVAVGLLASPEFRGDPAGRGPERRRCAHRVPRDLGGNARHLHVGARRVSPPRGRRSEVRDVPPASARNRAARARSRGRAELRAPLVPRAVSLRRAGTGSSRAKTCALRRSASS